MLPRLCSCYEFLRSDEVIDRIQFIQWAATTQEDHGLLIAVLERLDEIRREGDVDEVLTKRDIEPMGRTIAPRQPHVPTASTNKNDYMHHQTKNLFPMLWQLIHDSLQDLFCCGRGTQKQDFRDFEWGKLDPVRFVRVYRYLKQLDGHVYNIYEATCLQRTGDSPRILSSREYHQGSESLRDRKEIEQEQKHEDSLVVDWTVLNVILSCLAIATQIVFILFIITETVAALGETFQTRDNYLILSNCVITVATITIFMGFVLENYVASYRSTNVIQALRVRRAEFLLERIRRDFALLLNLLANGLLGYLLFWLNIPFILAAESVTDAILNSLATVFLLEIDDRVKPFQPTDKFGLDIIDWDNVNATNNLIKLAHEYLYFKRDTRIPDFVQVTKVFKTFEETRDAELLRHSYSPQDYCRIYVDDWNDNAKDHRITVFRLANEQMFPSVYEEIIYFIEGPGAKEFVANVRHFRRIHTDTPDDLNEFSRKRALRSIGKRRSRSVLQNMLEFGKNYGREYLAGFDDEDNIMVLDQQDNNNNDNPIANHKKKPSHHHHRRHHHRRRHPEPEMMEQYQQQQAPLELGTTNIYTVEELDSNNEDVDSRGNA